jgi:hypothetical protein
MLLPCLLFLSSPRRPYAAAALGNWTATVHSTLPVASLSLPSFAARVTRLNSTVLSADIFESNASSDPLASFFLTVPKEGPLQFGLSPDSMVAIAPIARTPAVHAASGRWERLLFDFVYASSSRVHLTLIDAVAGELIAIRFAKDKDTEQKSWMSENIGAVLFGTFSFLVQAAYTWFTRDKGKNAPKKEDPKTMKKAD